MKIVFRSLLNGKIKITVGKIKITVAKDDEANVYFAVSDDIGLAVEAKSLYDLMAEIQKAIPELIDADNPELTKEDFARMRPATEVFPKLKRVKKPIPRGVGLKRTK